MHSDVCKQTNIFKEPGASVNTMFPDMRKELMEEQGQNIKIKNVKSPELVVKINKVTVNALINTGSAINALSESWYHNNKSKIGKHEILSVNNTTIISAIGKKSKHKKANILRS